MPSFEIADGPTSVSLEGSSTDPKAPRKGSAVYNVTNKSGQSCGGRISVQTTGQTKAEWFTIDGDKERTFAAGETQTAAVSITVPPEVASGDYSYRIRVVAVNDPDNDHAEGPVTTAKVPAPVTGPKKKIWPWILLGLVVLVAVGVGLYFLLAPPPPPPTQTCSDGSVIPADSKCPPPPQKCSDGSVIPADGKCPPPPAQATAPRLIDKSVDAIAQNEGGYVIIKNETPNTDRGARIVYDQDPAPDTPLEPGKKIIVSYEPGVLVPTLPAGSTFTSAPNTLRGAGLEPGSFLCDRSSGTPGAVVGQVTNFSPAPGTRVAAKSKVDMFAIQAGRCFSVGILIPMKNFKASDDVVVRDHRLKIPGRHVP